MAHDSQGCADLKGQRNAHEDALLVRLAEGLPLEVKGTVLADRKWFYLLEHGLGFE